MAYNRASTSAYLARSTQELTSLLLSQQQAGMGAEPSQMAYAYNALGQLVVGARSQSDLSTGIRRSQFQEGSPRQGRGLAQQ